MTGPASEPATQVAALDHWIATRGWQAFPFQRAVWEAMLRGESGLLHATTGSGKTLAVWLGALARARALDAARAAAAPGRRPAKVEALSPPLQVLWLTPMRALATDSLRALVPPAQALLPRWSISLRTGDTPPAERARQDRRFPTALVTTPESLTLMLTRPEAPSELATVHTVIVDEWHELVGNKRGVQVQLALARLRRFNPGLIAWGLSATLGNLAEAMRTLVGDAAPGTLVQGRVDKPLVIDTLLPADPGRFSWGGHLGAQMQPQVVEEIARSQTCLVFTNTRSQAEIWYQMLLDARPDWAGAIALHHGSLARPVREWVELGLKEGRLKAVVATSSLDLGVDFLPVERVLQIGSPKGVARLLQRAGRSGHAPGRASRVTIVPTHTLEMVEAAAARRAALAGRIEHRTTPAKPLDVLVQHLVTVALGGGFRADELFEEVRGAPAYRTLARAEFDWCVAFVERGGDSLHAYPEYHRVVRDEGGVWRVPDRAIARRHRLSVGTIVSDAMMQVKWVGGGTIGTIEEGFIARLNKGDVFVFAGRLLEYVRTQDLAAYVTTAKKKRGVVPIWNGGRMPLSSELADSVVEVLADASAGGFDEPELQAARGMLQTQARLSRLPGPGRLLVERFRSREGHHLFIYPFAGRNVHIGLAGLLGWRLAQRAPNTFSMSVNDYGFELLGAGPMELAGLGDAGGAGGLLSDENLLHDVLGSLNARELAQRRFREIARIAGLVFTGYPGAPKALRQIQASSSLFYEVFRKYDSGNRLLAQSETEVLAQELEIGRLGATLARLRTQRVELVDLEVPSPFALPLMVERFREQLTTEKLAERLERILREADKALGLPVAPVAPRRPGALREQSVPGRRRRKSQAD
jgi:ATP-dependent Lhr-like helicase